MSALKEGAARLGIDLSAEQLALFARYLTLLIDGNRRANLISRVSPDEIEARHFLDSLTLAAAIEPGQTAGADLLDIGSGAGLPGVPLAIAYPDCRVTLLDATGKKVAFLETVKDELGLSGVTVVSGRSETTAHDAHMRESFDLVVARALARLPTLAELMLPFCRVGGICVAYKGRGVTDELGQASTAIASCGGGRPRVVEVDDAVFGEAREARLVVMPKIAATPERFPRREGVPGRRPL